jgi:hypothetical protein
MLIDGQALDTPLTRFTSVLAQLREAFDRLAARESRYRALTNSRGMVHRPNDSGGSTELRQRCLLSLLRSVG